MAIVLEAGLNANRHAWEMLTEGFNSGLIPTTNGFWTGTVITIAALQTAIYTPSTNTTPVAGLHEWFNNFARHLNNVLTACKTYGLLTDANVSTVQGTAAGSRQATFLAFFTANDSTLATVIPTAPLAISFAGAAG